jgi:hypothetical protein
MMAPHARERGSTLIISLVFLLVFLVMALSIFRGALTSSQAIGNMQWRNEAISAANETIDLLLSNASVATQTLVVVDDVNGKGGIPYDINGDNTADVIVRFPTINGLTGPQCLRVRPIPSTELSPSRAEDAGCFTSSTAGGIAVEGGGGATPASGPSSLCANSEWSMTVRATDASTSTSVDVTQGFAVRVPTVSIPDECE